MSHFKTREGAEFGTGLLSSTDRLTWCTCLRWGTRWTLHYGDDGLGEIFDMLDTVDKVDLMILVPIMKMVDIVGILNILSM